MAPRLACKCCNQICEGHLMVTCCVCMNKFKHSCVDITANEVRTLNSNKGYDWTCIDCRVIGKDLKELKALIINLQNDIKQLKEANSATINSSEIDYEDIISEVTERQRRKKNVMVFNLPEPDQSKTPTEQVDSDKNAVDRILSAVNPNLSSANFKIVRLGSFSPTKVRPIKITTNNEDTVKTILANSKKLQSKNEFRKVRISSDRTKRQLEHYKKVKQELTDRINSGEANCRIRYFNDIPRVISLN